MYQLIKPLLFKTDPETIHYRMIRLAQLARAIHADALLKPLYSYAHPMLEQTLCGIHFKNPVGLAAGFDKNAQLCDIIHTIGFGYEEVGSITAAPLRRQPKTAPLALARTQQHCRLLRPMQ